MALPDTKAEGRLQLVFLSLTFIPDVVPNAYITTHIPRQDYLTLATI